MMTKERFKKTFMFAFFQVLVNDLTVLNVGVSARRMLAKFVPCIPDSKVHGANVGPTWVL